MNSSIPSSQNATGDSNGDSFMNTPPIPSASSPPPPTRNRNPKETSAAVPPTPGLPPTTKAASEKKLHLPYKPHVSAGWKLPGVAQYKVNQWLGQVRLVNSWESQRRGLSDSQIRKEALSLIYRAKSGELLEDLLPETYSLVREAGRRAMNMRHYDVQILGGTCLFYGCIAEMQTGEGKTLTATLPMVLHSLVGKGAHLATVNDYLAERDADWMRPLYDALGLSVGIVLTNHNQDERRRAYSADVTYGTAKEFGFDFLRDRLLMRAQGRAVDDFLGAGSSERWSSSGEQPVQRGMHFVLVDEADSILIDEARTPLIIGSLGDEAREVVIATYKWAAKHAPLFELKEHFTIEEDNRKIELTGKGRQFVRALPRDEVIRLAALVDLYEYIERAIKVHRDFSLDRQYVVRDGEIVIVDEFTGRLAEGRKWRDGIHQAIEAKENIDVSVPTGQAARITVQDLFLRYKRLGGMTGTAATSAGEMRRIYKTPVVQVPTNRPPKRIRLPDIVCPDMMTKFHAIVEEVKGIHAKGRPILIGTRSIDKSSILANLLRDEGLGVQVLNAYEVEREAEIVSRAGERGAITVATNMAGRGTDIKLQDEIREIGGMFVICTELHDAARIDRQLIGRCGRQGDPGSYRQYLGMDDEILRNGLGAKVSEKMKKIGAAEVQNPRAIHKLNRFASQFKRAQRKVEKKHFRDRMALLYHEKERTKIQREMGQDPYLDTAE
ncbi:preprotein translocase subunit SecA [Pirellula sp. SH-Sr6A]|uniref:preprotein translocase subunit SecA n=1 Tax=Pirellula sp. SH-Sr6A TaxID=1632865 RepID=UPI00078D7CBB|nr:preprotein translocase subunit SecA [Pirellula sp. SH-Sr6A]AMV30993.1 preprotein translocase subunit SecA [Pirellula sp. SH-Sr6A]